MPVSERGIPWPGRLGCVSFRRRINYFVIERFPGPPVLLGEVAPGRSPTRSKATLQTKRTGEPDLPQSNAR